MHNLKLSENNSFTKEEVSISVNKRCLDLFDTSKGGILPRKKINLIKRGRESGAVMDIAKCVISSHLLQSIKNTIILSNCKKGVSTNFLRATYMQLICELGIKDSVRITKSSIIFSEQSQIIFADYNEDSIWCAPSIEKIPDLCIVENSELMNEDQIFSLISKLGGLGSSVIFNWHPYKNTDAIERLWRGDLLCDMVHDQSKNKLIWTYESNKFIRYPHSWIDVDKKSMSKDVFKWVYLCGFKP